MTRRRKKHRTSSAQGPRLGFCNDFSFRLEVGGPGSEGHSVTEGRRLVSEGPPGLGPVERELVAAPNFPIVLPNLYPRVFVAVLPCMKWFFITPG